MNKIINLTQHAFSVEQIQSITDEGLEIVQPSTEDLDAIKRLITFDSLADCEKLRGRARVIANICESYGAKHAMIGGAPFFMGVLEDTLKETGVIPRYAFSTRRVVEKTQEDGTVVKTSVFVHEGWVKA